MKKFKFSLISSCHIEDFKSHSQMIFSFQLEENKLDTQFAACDSATQMEVYEETNGYTLMLVTL